MFSNSDFSIDFDTPTVKEGAVHYEKTNDLTLLEIEELDKDYSTKKFLNPFGKEYRVILDKTKADRYSLAIGLHDTSVAKVSAILSGNYVNIAYWDTYPNVIKNVPISHITLYENSTKMHKIKFKLIKALRFIFRLK